MEKGTLIIGGGVIGLSIGWRLRARGEPVTLLERGETGREASWADAIPIFSAVWLQSSFSITSCVVGTWAMRRASAIACSSSSSSGTDSRIMPMRAASGALISSPVSR